MQCLKQLLIFIQLFKGLLRNFFDRALTGIVKRLLKF